MTTLNIETGDRMILTCKNNLSYAGVMLGMLRSPADRKCVAIELDQESGFAVLCPIDFIQEIKKVPISGGRPR